MFLSTPRFVLSGVLVCLLVAGRAGRAAETEWRVFGCRPGTQTRYDFSVTGTVTAAQYQLDVFRSSAAGSGITTVAIHSVDREVGAARQVTSGAPLFFLTVDGHGVVRSATTAILQRDSVLRNFLWDELAFASGTEPLAPGHEWTSKERSRDSLFLEPFQVTHRVEAEGPNLRVRSSVPDGLEFERGLGRKQRRVTVQRWERSLVVDLADNTIVSVQLDLRAKASWLRGVTACRYHLSRRSHRVLSSAEVEALDKEVALLMAVEEAVHDQRLGYRRQGLLGTLFGAARKDPRDPLQLLDRYQQEYPDAFFSDLAKGLRASVERHLARFERERREQNRGAELVGKLAPDFSLEDMDGRDVSLKDYRGKVVLLSFWGYG